MKKCDHCGGSDRRQCYDSDLSDAAFAVIQPILASRPKAKSGRPMEYPWREILNTIFYLLRTGCQWRNLPHDLGKWWVAYRWFRTLTKDGTWRVIHDELHLAVRRLEGVGLAQRGDGGLPWSCSGPPGTCIGGPWRCSTWCGCACCSTTPPAPRPAAAAQSADGGDAA